MDLIQQAKERGYKVGIALRYVPHAIDFLEGDNFEIQEGNLVAYCKPINERISFEDYRFDTLFNSKTGKWVEIVDLTKRTADQKHQDDIHYINSTYP